MIDFLKYRSYSYVLSLLLSLSLVVGILYKRSFRPTAFLYGVEFTGGTQVTFQTSNDMGSDELSKILDALGMGAATIRQFSKTEHLIRIGSEHWNENSKEAFISALKEKDSSAEVTIKQIETIGSGVGKELKPKAVLAIVCALILMLLYVWLRFNSLAFALANFISLAHDVLAIILFVLFFDYEISLDIIAAVLFILGYSINDTIVIFSRIRENFAKKKSEVSSYDVISSSIWETLRRTLLTSLFTTLVVIPLVLLGGAALQSLSAALLLGIVFGTYSSILIAAPLFYDLKKHFNF